MKATFKTFLNTFVAFCKFLSVLGSNARDEQIFSTLEFWKVISPSEDVS